MKRKTKENAHAKKKKNQKRGKKGKITNQKKKIDKSERREKILIYSLERRTLIDNFPLLL